MSITPAGVMQRVHYWNQNPPPNGYDQGAEWPAPDGARYRCDCSGFVSMCWALGSIAGGLGSASPNTSELATSTWTTPISKDQLAPGDVLLAVAGNGREFGHVVIFESWTDSSQTAYNGHEFGFGAAPLHSVVPYPYHPSDPRQYSPRRGLNVAHSAAEDRLARTVFPGQEDRLARTVFPGSVATAPAAAPLPLIQARPHLRPIPYTGVAEVDARNRLARVVIAGRRLAADVTDRISAATMSYSSTQVGQLTLTIKDDPDGRVWRSGLFKAGMSIDYADQHMDLRDLSVAGTAGSPELTVIGRSRVISSLRGGRQSAPGSYGTVDVGSWAKDRAAEVGARMQVQSGLGRMSIARQKGETTWDVFQRLAQELGCWCWEADQTIVLAKPSYLIGRPQTRGWRLWWRSWTDYTPILDGMPAWSISMDRSSPEQLTFGLIAKDADRARPGDYVTVDGTGGWTGDWIITGADQPLKLGQAVKVTCDRPLDPRPAPAQVTP